YNNYLPEHIIELEVIETPAPDYDVDTQRRIKLDYLVDVDNKTYTAQWQVIDLTQEEIELRQAQKDWLYPLYQFRLRVPTALGEQYPSIYAHFMLQKLPIVYITDDDTIVDVYINTILPHHSSLLQELQDVVEIHDRPKILDNEEMII
ncbi:MAG: hypothetical protein ACOC2W_02215, partial [bacterium]